MPSHSQHEFSQIHTPWDACTALHLPRTGIQRKSLTLQTACRSSNLGRLAIRWMAQRPAGGQKPLLALCQVMLKVCSRSV